MHAVRFNLSEMRRKSSRNVGIFSSKCTWISTIRSDGDGPDGGWPPAGAGATCVPIAPSGTAAVAATRKLRRDRMVVMDGNISPF